MKNLCLLSALYFCLITSFGQTQITLTFQAKDSLTQNPLALDSVDVANLTVSCDTVLYDAVSTLNMNALWPVGQMEPVPGSRETFIVMPNPFEGKTMVKIWLTEPGPLNLYLHNGMGKPLAQHHGEHGRGWHLFSVSSGNQGMLFLVASDSRNTRTVKLINTRPSGETNRIASYGQAELIPELKSSRAGSFFIYHLGDQLRYTAYAGGYHASVLYDSPLSNHTYTFAMLAETVVTAPVVSTSVASGVTQTTALSGGNVLSDGGAMVTARGVCYSTTPDPTLASNITNDGSGTGAYLSNLTGLLPATPYFVRAYAINSAGTAYGNEETFTTLPLTAPTVNTTPAYAITQTTATSGGDVTFDGGTDVTARGVCWSTTPGPTTAGSHTTNGGGTGIFTSNITGLTPNTPYYLRAYAVNSVGTAYGAEQPFTTPGIAVPAVTTTPASAITQTSASSGGNVTSDGGAAVTARGVCWSTSPGPTTAGSHTTDGSGTGIFVSNLTGLNPNTPYYIRAYATNSMGTAYGNELSFTTLSAGFVCGDVLNYSGKNYNTVLIGTQCWFRDNLNVGVRVDGLVYQSNNGIMEKFCYDNLESNCDIYGGLYQWNETMQFTTTPGAQGVCPSGWHVPTDGEWTILTDFLGGEAVAGGAMKQAGTTMWLPPNTGATNSSGFTALPSAWYYSSMATFDNLGELAEYWTSNQTTMNMSWVRGLNYITESIIRASDGYQGDGFSVRCLKN